MCENVTNMRLTDFDIQHLERCLELAEIALENGDEPFGSVLVSDAGEVLFEDHNRVKGGDHTRHPEFEIARWAAQNLSPEQRSSSTVYTSGEHCPMCAAAHGWVGLGRIVYACSGALLAEWMKGWGAKKSPVAALQITDVVPQAETFGPVPEFLDRSKELYRRAFAC